MKNLIFLILLISCIKQSGKKDDIIYYNIGGEPAILNPISGSSDSYTSSVSGYMFESLLERDIKTYEWKNLLATSYKISADKKSYEFDLRQGVKWHDGVEFTAEDVKFSFDLVFDDFYKVAFLRPYYEAIEKVDIINKYKVKFYIKDDYYANFDVASGMTIYPKHFYGNKDNKKLFNKKVIGTGPYVLDKHIRGQKIILKKNQAWWGNLTENSNENRINRIVLRFITDNNISLELFKKGNLDFIPLTPELYIKKTSGKEWKEKLVKVKAVNKTGKGYTFISFNFKHPILKDIRARKALSLLFNRPLMRKKFEFDMSELATGPVYVQSDYAPKDLAPVPFDPNEARKILKEAGFKDEDRDGILEKIIDGKKMNFSFTVMAPSEKAEKYLTIFKEDAKKLGIEINLKIVEWNTFIKLLDEKKFESLMLSWTGGGVEFDPKQIWHSSSMNGGSNFISYSNPEVDQLIDKSRKMYDRDERIKVLKEVAKKIAYDYPYIFFFNSTYTLYANQKRIIKEVDTYPYGIGNSFWTIKKEE
jgi:ABC-type transport system substrate-binding protein